MRRSAAALAAIGLVLSLGATCEPAATPSAGSESAVPSPAESTSGPASTAGPTGTPTPTVEKRIVTETKVIAYKTRRVSDPALAEGETRVRRAGVRGVRTLTYEVTVTGGAETGRKLVRSVVTRAPVDRVIAVGTKRAPRCDPNYSGACVPITSDVDCAGGSGDGPGYVDGPVRVVGSDIYDLDRDGDGIACD